MSDGTPLLDLNLSYIGAVLSEMQSMYDKQAHLDIIAQIVGELCLYSDEFAEKASHIAEDMLFTRDHHIGNLFSGKFQQQIIILS